MAYLETHSRTHGGKVERKGTKPSDAKTGVCQCLIVSAATARREMLSRAAANGGWNPIVCPDRENASVAFRRTRCQMALIDLDHEGSTPEGFRDLCQRLSSASPRLLLVVCGHQDQPQEEIWARQLGVWVYLPGISLAKEDEISAICQQAILLGNIADPE